MRGDVYILVSHSHFHFSLSHSTSAALCSVLSCVFGAFRGSFTGNRLSRKTDDWSVILCVFA